MKLSISLANDIAKEIQMIAKETERTVSWWIQRAWLVSRAKLLQTDRAEAQRSALKKIASLRGALKKSYPNVDSVALSHKAFRSKH